MLHQIGVGALGPVFRTYEPERDRLVAVKVFRLDITPEQAQELAAEVAKVADAGLFHPSIVEPIGAGVEGAVAYGAEEYVAAESLDVAMRDYAPAPVDTALPFITQLAGAIDFARAAGVGHGALHPRDIFVTPEDVRATGFGVVEALERVGLRAPVRRPYSPPERIEGGVWSTPADVFSLAAIAFELLTGRRPAGLGAEIGPLTSGTPNGWAGALHAVLARAMDPDPDRRYPTALALASALEGAARGDISAAGVQIGGAAALTSAAPGGEAPRDVPSDEVDVPSDEEVSDAALVAGGFPADEPDAAGADAERELSHRDEFTYEPDYDLGHDARGPADDPLVLRDAGVDAHAEDIAIEREGDEAHQQFVLQEMSEPAPAADPYSEFRAPDAPASEPDSDRFIAEAAAAAPAAFADDFREPGTHTWEALPEDHEPAPRGLTLGLAPEPRLDDEAEPIVSDPAVAGAVSPDAWLDEDRRQQQPMNVPSERSYGRRWPDDDVEDVRPQDDRRPVWLAAALLVVGLVGGLGVGYLAWGRAPANPATAADVFLSGGGEAGATTGAAGAAAEPVPAADDMPVPPADPPPAVGEQEPPATAPPAAARATRGTLVVRSTPSGAGVTVNGRWRGRTPLTLDDLPFARYQVRVVEPGYNVAIQTVTLSAGSPEGTMAVQLEQQAPPAARGTPPAGRAGTPPAQTPPGPQAFTGSIYVDSRPRGAAVSINGKRVGETPLRIPEMPIGTHVVRLELPNHRIWSSTARVTAGQEARVTGSLDPIR